MEFYAQKAQGVKLERLPVKGDQFHAVEIEGLIFCAEAHLFEPYITRYAKRNSSHSLGWVQLGHPAIITEVSSYKEKPGGKAAQEWHICKYNPNQPRISLEGLSSAGRNALAHEFGIDIEYCPGELDQHELQQTAALNQSMCNGTFYESPAFASLCEYAKAHPKKAKKWEPNNYLGNWAEAARTGQPLKTINLLSWMD